MSDTTDENTRMRNRDISGMTDEYGHGINPALPPIPPNMRNSCNGGHVVRNAVEVIVRP